MVTHSVNLLVLRSCRLTRSKPSVLFEKLGVFISKVIFVRYAFCTLYAYTRTYDDEVNRNAFRERRSRTVFRRIICRQRGLDNKYIIRSTTRSGRTCRSCRRIYYYGVRVSFFFSFFLDSAVLRRPLLLTLHTTINVGVVWVSIVLFLRGLSGRPTDRRSIITSFR